MKQKILYGILAVAISFGLWWYVVTVVSPEFDDTFYDIPVVLSGETFLQERGLMVLDEKLPTVTLKLSGNRSVLSKLNSGNITLVADLSKISDTGEQQLTFSVVYPGDVPQNSVEVLSREPSTIEVNVVNRSQKEVDVEVTYNGAPPEGYIADKNGLELSHEKVTVTGPTSVIDRIDHARVEVNLGGQNETISKSYTYTLCDESGEPVDAQQVQTNVNEIDLTLKILRFKELELVLDVIYGGGATEENTKITLDQQVIQVAGAEQVLEKLENLNLGTLDLSKVMESGKTTFQVVLPEGVDNITGIETVEVTVEFTGLVTKQLTVTNIRATNVPVALTAKILNKSLVITMRGTAKQLEKLKAEDITVYVDFSGAEAGSFTFDAVIRTGSSFQDVGAIGTYSVSATLTEK